MMYSHPYYNNRCPSCGRCPQCGSYSQLSYGGNTLGYGMGQAPLQQYGVMQAQQANNLATAGQPNNRTCGPTG